MKRHKCNSQKRKLTQCHICKKNCSTKRDLSAHLWTHRDDLKPLVCKTCSKVFVWKSDLINHERYHQSERSFPCDKCDKRFRTNYHLKMHKICHTNKKPFQCNICKKSFNRLTNMKAHKMIHLKDDCKPHKCKICPKTFRRADRLALHMQTHSKKQLFRCQFCKRAYDNFNDLESHLHVHKNSLICKICSQSFAKITDVLLHEEKFHNNSKRIFKCKQCKEKFKRKVYLNNHMRIHYQNDNNKNNIQPNTYECDICKNCYSTYRNIERHIKMHMKCFDVYDCPICEKSFSRQRQMNAHILTHVGAKPFVCDICNKSYLQKSYLMIHIRDVHELKKHLACKICHKQFVKISHLIKHENLVHSLKKFYECNACGKKFYAKSDLIVHLDSHSNEKPFECDICLKKYKHKHSMLLHKIREHNSKKAERKSSKIEKANVKEINNLIENKNLLCNNDSIRRDKDKVKVCEGSQIFTIEPKNNFDANLMNKNFVDVVVKEEYSEMFESYDIEIEDVKIELED